MTAAHDARHSDARPGTLVVTGVGAVSGLGLGWGPLAGAYAGVRTGATDPATVGGEAVPQAGVYALADFSIRDVLGRKGTSFFDRGTGLGIVACTQALEDAGAPAERDDLSRFGIVLGTTHGSMQSTSDYSRDTFTQERPYHVNPLLFPNAVMNSVAGQAAIWTGLRGPNSTIAGGSTAMAQVLRYGQNLLRCGYATTMLAGAVEEFSAVYAWRSRAQARAGGGALPPGEGAAAVVLETEETARLAGRVPAARLLAVEVGSFDPPSEGIDEFGGRIAGCVRMALARAGLAAAEVGVVLSGRNGSPAADAAEQQAVDDVFGRDQCTGHLADAVGEAGAAFGGLQLAALVGASRNGLVPADTVVVLLSRTVEGTVGVTIARIGDAR